MVAIYAFDYELARAPRVSTNPLIGEMRLAFWHEVLDEIFEGRRVRAHPAAQALMNAVGRRELPREPLQAMIEGRDRQLDRSLLTAGEAIRLAAATGGEAARLAAKALGSAQDEGPAASLGARWALARFLADGTIVQTDGEKARARLQEKVAGRLGVAAFPAAAHAALVPIYARSRRPSELEKRLRITWAVATGRI